MKSYNLLKVLLFAASVAVDVEAINKPAVGSSRTGRTSTGNTRKFIVEVEPMEGVVNVWHAHKVAMPEVEKTENGPSSSIRNYSIHHWTGVDKLHAAGIRGKGSTVAIIDTGIDYTHKALGGCFGPGCKVKGGYDLVGADWETHNERKHPKQPDNDPMDYQGHGTHVAGIIAAKNEWQVLLTGVAPEAELLIYKVFSDDPWETDEETIMQALCDAYNAGADVITSSIGQPNGWSDNPWAMLASRLVDKGVIVIASAGNEGEFGPFYSSSGAVGRGVLAVAAANVTTKPNANRTGEDLEPLPVYFTTWGPTNELLLKPDITAPGYMIMSTVLNQSYEELSGTSMSAPYIAGVAALFVGQYGGRAFNGAGFAKMLRDRIASSGTTLPFVNNRLMRKYKASPFQVGTGLVDAWKVLNYDTQLEYEPFSLMDTELFQPRWSFNVTNTGGIAHEYTFKLEPQAGFNIYDPEYGVALLYAIEPKNIVPPVRLPHRVLIEPGETRELSVTFGLPNVDDDYLPLYSGKVLINSDHGEKLSIPYGGAAYDTEKAFDNMFIVDPFVTDPDKDSAWSFNIDRDASDFIEIGGRASYACDNLRWDIFEQGWSESLWTYPPRVGRHGFIGSATTMRDAEEFWFFDPTVNDPNDTVPFPLKQQSRGFHVFWWFGKLANGTRIAPGNYTMRFAALRPYGNPNISDHWDIMNSPTASSIQVLPYNSTRNSTLKYRAPKYQTPSLGKGFLKG
ncbi:peptidase S8/S53 domain-containing protein [Fusarium redolens]|uniref:Peptidase S8/S53 domain-containing protein n=1 Tax=Fusarium redolens TaxID=48865 RepID=A0A9P9KA43_FUSRE|nr:peptidase S8/S53 domain-containing protein [Fusarium redolens]KAH7249731.1 peptidase S8/S53 domain-containing protein [Fusarium redolens]